MQMNVLEDDIYLSLANLSPAELDGIKAQACHETLRTVSEPLCQWVAMLIDWEQDRRLNGPFVPIVLGHQKMDHSTLGKALHAALVMADAQPTERCRDFAFSILRLVGAASSARLQERHIVSSN